MQYIERASRFTDGCRTLCKMRFRAGSRCCTAGKALWAVVPLPSVPSSHVQLQLQQAPRRQTRTQRALQAFGSLGGCGMLAHVVVAALATPQQEGPAPHPRTRLRCLQRAAAAAPTLRTVRTMGFERKQHRL